MRVFADRYPDEVAGMVLLDAQPADAFTALPDYPSFYGRIGSSRRWCRHWPALALGSPSVRRTIRPASGRLEA